MHCESESHVVDFVVVNCQQNMDMETLIQESDGMNCAAVQYALGEIPWKLLSPCGTESDYEASSYVEEGMIFHSYNTKETELDFHKKTAVISNHYPSAEGKDVDKLVADLA